MDKIKASIKNFLSKNGFEKIKGYHIRNIENNYYLIAKVIKENNYTYLDEEKSKKAGMPWYFNTGLPFYDILITLSRLYDKSDLDYEDPRYSVCKMSLTPKENWVLANEQSEERIISEMKLAFEKVCICPLFSQRDAHFSVYEYVVWMHKIQGVYLDPFFMLWFADLAVDCKQYAEALVWLKRAVSYSCEKSKTSELEFTKVNTAYDIGKEEKDLVSNEAYLCSLGEFIEDDSNFDYEDIKKYVSKIYYSIIKCL